MSLQTWKEEFMPSADEASKDLKSAVDHTIKKIEGLKPSNLAKHNCIYDYGDVYDADEADVHLDDYIRVTCISSCALCLRYNSHCSQCVIYTYLDVCCGVTQEYMDLKEGDYEGALQVIKDLRNDLFDPEED